MSIRISNLPSSEQIEAAANDRIDRRKSTGRALIEVASQLQHAQVEVEKLTKQYADVYKDATTDAWTVKELAAQGLPSLDQPVRRRRRQNPDTSAQKGDN